MNLKLDKTLLRRARRRRAAKELTEAECIAINLFWREGASATVLAKVFGRARNTIYYWCLTGDAASYPRNNKRAREINDIIEEMGADAARAKYVTPALVAAVDKANKQHAA